MPLGPPPQTFVRRHRRTVIPVPEDQDRSSNLSSDHGRGDSSVRMQSGTSGAYVESPRALYNRQVGRRIQEDYESRIRSLHPDLIPNRRQVGANFGVTEGLSIFYREQVLRRISLEGSTPPIHDMLELPDINDF